MLYQAELLPDKQKNYAPKRSRTPNLLIRSQTLYPVELWAHLSNAEDRNRTGTVITHRRILSPVRLPVPPPRHNSKAENGFRTRDPHLGKVVLYH